MVFREVVKAVEEIDRERERYENRDHLWHCRGGLKEDERGNALWCSNITDALGHETVVRRYSFVTDDGMLVRVEEYHADGLACWGYCEAAQAAMEDFLRRMGAVASHIEAWRRGELFALVPRRGTEHWPHPEYEHIRVERLAEHMLSLESSAVRIVFGGKYGSPLFVTKEEVDRMRAGRAVNTLLDAIGSVPPTGVDAIRAFVEEVGAEAIERLNHPMRHKVAREVVGRAANKRIREVAGVDAEVASKVIARLGGAVRALWVDPKTIRRTAAEEAK